MQHHCMALLDNTPTSGRSGKKSALRLSLSQSMKSALRVSEHRATKAVLRLGLSPENGYAFPENATLSRAYICTPNPNDLLLNHFKKFILATPIDMVLIREPQCKRTRFPRCVGSYLHGKLDILI